MALLELRDEHALAQTSDDLAGLWLSRSGDLQRDLEDPAVFANTVGRLADAARAIGAEAIKGVSHTGQTLAEAVAGELRLQTWRGDRVASLLLVDGLVNTGIQIALAVRAAQAVGVHDVRALAIRADARALDRLNRTGAQVAALEVI